MESLAGFWISYTHRLLFYFYVYANDKRQRHKAVGLSTCASVCLRDHFSHLYLLNDWRDLNEADHN